MTEERIIVTNELLTESANRAGDFKAFLLILSAKAELAPPKDWRPLCFDENTGANEEYCNGVHETNWMGYIQKELEDNCRKCPYRLQPQERQVRP